MQVRSWLINLGVLAVSVAAFFAVTEVALRLVGFSFRVYPETIEFGHPDPKVMASGFVADDDLIWVTQDYQEELARYRETRPRLLFLGDSCTYFGAYDEALARLVADRGQGTLSHGNLGVAGWSSYQGLQQLERDVLPLAPSVVTVYFGWNDHWIGFGIEDKDVARIQQGLPTSTWQRLRTVQLASKARLALAGAEGAFPNRVPIEDFAGNLHEIVASARRAGTVAMLITAPSSHQVGHEPPYLASRWLRDLSELVPLHRAYAEVVREVAAETGAPLCDAAAAFASLPRPALESSMLRDGIHLTDEGDRRLADLLYDCLEREGLLSAVVTGL